MQDEAKRAELLARIERLRELVEQDAPDLLVVTAFEAVGNFLEESSDEAEREIGDAISDTALGTPLDP